MKPRLAEQLKVHKMTVRDRFTLGKGQPCRNETEPFKCLRGRLPLAKEKK